MVNSWVKKKAIIFSGGFLRIQTGDDFLTNVSFVFHHTVLFSMNLHRKIRVRGRVQGGGFRDATWRKAMELGILGSVLNLDNGCVEIWHRQNLNLWNSSKTGVEMGLPTREWIKSKFLSLLRLIFWISGLNIEFARNI